MLLFPQKTGNQIQHINHTYILTESFIFDKDSRPPQCRPPRSKRMLIWTTRIIFISPKTAAVPPPVALSHRHIYQHMYAKARGSQDFDARRVTNRVETGSRRLAARRRRHTHTHTNCGEHLQRIRSAYCCGAVLSKGGRGRCRATEGRWTTYTKFQRRLCACVCVCVVRCGCARTWIMLCVGHTSALMKFVCLWRFSTVSRRTWSDAVLCVCCTMAYTICDMYRMHIGA